MCQRMGEESSGVGVRLVCDFGTICIRMVVRFLVFGFLFSVIPFLHGTVTFLGGLFDPGWGKGERLNFLLSAEGCGQLLDIFLIHEGPRRTALHLPRRSTNGFLSAEGAEERGERRTANGFLSAEGAEGRGERRTANGFLSAEGAEGRGAENGKRLLIRGGRGGTRRTANGERLLIRGGRGGARRTANGF